MLVEAELGGAEADQIVVFDKPAAGALGRSPTAGRVARAGEEHRQAAEGQAGPAPVADLLTQGEALFEQCSPVLEVAAGASQVAERIERERFPLPVGELLEAGKALLDQLPSVCEVPLDPLHRGEVDQDVGGRGRPVHPPRDENGVLLQQQRIAGLVLRRDQAIAERP